MEELKRLAEARDRAEEELLRCLREDASIAEKIKEVWINQSSGAD